MRLSPQLGVRPKTISTMWAPARPRRLTLLVLAGCLAGAGVSVGAAAPTHPLAPATPGAIWAVELGGKSAAQVRTSTLKRLRSRRINALVLDPSRVRPGVLGRVRAQAARAGLVVLNPAPRSKGGSGKRPAGACGATGRKGREPACSVFAPDLDSALGMANTHRADFVVIRAGDPGAIRRLRARQPRGRIVVATRLSGTGLNRTAWRDAMLLAKVDPMLDLAVTPTGATGARALDAYLSLLGAGVSDTISPAAPANLARTASTSTSVTITWAAASDNLAVTAYSVSRAGAAPESTTMRSHTFTGLVCGTIYEFGVEASDASGNVSGRSTITTSSEPCSLLDPVPPWPPTNLRQTDSTDTSVSVAWDPAFDLTGVSGYVVYANGSSVGQTSSTSFLVTGQACGMVLSIEVDAFDAAGNHSLRSLRLHAATDSCAPSPPPPPPPPPPLDTTPPSATLTSPSAGPAVHGTVPVSATASDNVGVVGVQFKLDGLDLGVEDTSAPYSRNWNTTTASNGSHTITAVARDAAGNTTTSAPAVVTVDNSAPTVAMTAPVDGSVISGAAVAVSATAADNAGVVGVQFRLDGANLGSEDANTPYSRSWNTTSATDGPHALTAVARDAAGNQTTSPVVSVTVDNSPPQPGTLAAAYSFDEGAGQVVADASGNDNEGVLTGATWSDGRFGKAVSFDGIDDWVTVADAASLDLTTAMTLEAWVKPTDVTRTTTWQTVLMKEMPGEISYSLYGSSVPTGQPRGQVNLGTTTGDVSGPSALPVNTWTHVAATYDGSNMRLYVNGNQAAWTPSSGPLDTSNGPLRIGGNSVWPTEDFAGLVDEVRVYGRALSAAEVATDMNTSIAAHPAAAASPGRVGSFVGAGWCGCWGLCGGAVSVDGVRVSAGVGG